MNMKDLGLFLGSLRIDGASHVFFIKLLNVFFGFFTVIVFARLLQQESYGNYVFMLALAQFLALPLQMGLPTLLTREISVGIIEESMGIVRGVQVWSRVVLLATGCIVGLILVISHQLLSSASDNIFLQLTLAQIALVILAMFLIAEIKVSMGILNGYSESMKSRVPEGIIRPVLLLVIGGIGVGYWSFTESGLLAAYIGASIVAVLVGWTWIAGLSTFNQNVVKVYTSRKWIHAILPLAFVSAASSLRLYTDVLMLGFIIGSEEVASYRVAVQVASLLTLAQVAAIVVVSPQMAAANAKNDLRRLQELAVKASRFGLMFALVLSLLIVVTGGPIVTILLGADYSSVYALTLTLGVGFLFASGLGGSSVILSMTYREKSVAKYAGWTAVLNVILNYFLIPPFGGLGAAIASTLTLICLNIMVWFRVKTALNIRTDAFTNIVNK